MKAIIGHKVGMTQMWDDKGRLVPATIIATVPNKVLTAADGRVLVGIPTKGRTSKPQAEIAKKLDAKRGISLKEFTDIEGVEAGGELTVAQFEKGELVSVSGVTKGKGFAGGMKRHGFHGGPASHGSDHQRAPGSIGAQRPQRVPKGQKMAGHMGAVSFTTRGNKVLEVQSEKGVLVVSGAIPGPARAQVIVRIQQ
jgi:large subunit ribosomal protein L3